MQTSHARRLTVTVIAAALMMLGCSGSAAPVEPLHVAPTREPFAASRHGRIVVADLQDGVSMAAALSGPLAEVGSCLGVSSTLVIWPAGTTWEDRTSTLTLPDGSSTTLGADMQIGGGNSTPDIAGFSAGTLHAVAECGASPTQDLWIV